MMVLRIGRTLEASLFELPKELNLDIVPAK